MPRLVAFPEFFALAVFVVVGFTLVVSALGQFLRWAGTYKSIAVNHTGGRNLPFSIFRSRFAVPNLPKRSNR